MRCLVEFFATVAMRSDGRPYLSPIAFKWRNFNFNYLQCPPIDFLQILRISQWQGQLTDEEIKLKGNLMVVQ